MKNEKPSIELYMYSLNQEFPVGKGHSNFIKRLSEMKQDLSGSLVNIETAESQIFAKNPKANDWAAQWISNEWITNWTKTLGMEFREDLDPLRNIIIREEDFGGIVFDPLSDRVYKVNKAGLKLFKEIQKYYIKESKKMKDFSSKNFKKDECEQFLSFLKGAALWIKS
jgi:hypothetical protein